MADMIERVALAIYNKATKFDGDEIGVHLGNSMMIDGSAANAEDLRRIVLSVCNDAARAAIEAMREPTDEMSKKAAAKSEHVSSDAHRRVLAHGYAHVYRDMIDAALSPSPSR